MLIGKMQKIMELRAKGYTVNFDFPTIAVIGSQSSGKSSVIEGIVGRHILPRGTNMVTRCPIVLNLYHEVDCPNDYAIFAPTEYDQVPKRIEDFSKVRDEITERTNKLIQGRYAVSDKCIVVNIHSESYPDNLQLIDLPGFVRNAVADQPADIKEQIESLVHKFIEKENTIVLAVSDALVDMAESAGISEARKVDVKGERTVGVLTKLDIIPKEKTRDVLDTLNNKLLPLSKGYVAVINSPPQDNEEDDFATLRDKEIDLFRKSAFTGKVRNCGTSYLQKKLNNELSLKIQDKIPELITRVNEELNSVQSELDALDYIAEIQTQGNTKRIVDKIKRYETAVIIMLGGNDRRVSHNEIQGGALLKNMLKSEMKTAREEAMQLNPGQLGKDIEIMLQNLDSSHDNVLPNSLVFRNCISILVERFKKPFCQLIDKFAEQLIGYMRKCAEETLSPVPNLKQKVLDNTTEKVFQFRDLCKDDMNRHIDVQKSFVNTGHPEFRRYYNLINGLKNELVTGEVFHDASTGEENKLPFLFDDEHSDKNIKWVKERANAFCFFQKDVGEIDILAVPIAIDKRKDFFLELVLAYMLILETSLCHSGLQLVMYHLIENVVQYHDNHDLYAVILDNNESEIEEYLEIDAYKQEKLDSLLQNQESCKEILKVLRDAN